MARSKHRKRPTNHESNSNGKNAKQRHWMSRVLQLLGPGIITGASDDDPSGIGTYATAGARAGYATLWLAPLTLPLMITVQFICAKVGMVTGKGLAGVIRHHYSRILLYPVVFSLVIANTINAGTDIGAIAAGIHLLLPIPVAILVVTTAILILAIQIWGSYRLITNIFKWLTLALLAYIGASLAAKPDWHEVLKATLKPQIPLTREFLSLLVAILGTTISPYMFFWQSEMEVEEQKANGQAQHQQRKGTTDEEVHYKIADISIGMLFSQVVMYFIILATAATLYKAGHHEISSAVEAAKALQPIAGKASSLLLALGLIGSGFLAVPILTGSGAYALSQAFGWKYGFDKKPKRAKGFYTVIAASTLVGLFINFIGINPIRALYWTAIINGFLAPPLLILIMLISNNASIMRDRKNDRLTNIVGWITTVIMLAACIAVVVTA